MHLWGPEVYTLSTHLPAPHWPGSPTISLAYSIFIRPPSRSRLFTAAHICPSASASQPHPNRILTPYSLLRSFPAYPPTHPHRHPSLLQPLLIMIHPYFVIMPTYIHIRDARVAATRTTTRLHVLGVSFLVRVHVSPVHVCSLSFCVSTADVAVSVVVYSHNPPCRVLVLALIRRLMIVCVRLLEL